MAWGCLLPSASCIVSTWDWPRSLANRNSSSRKIEILGVGSTHFLVKYVPYTLHENCTVKPAPSSLKHNPKELNQNRSFIFNEARRRTKVWCMVFVVFPSVRCGVWCAVCGVRCVVWCVMCGASCVACCVWCVVCYVRCVVCGVWCALPYTPTLFGNISPACGPTSDTVLVRITEQTGGHRIIVQFKLQTTEQTLLYESHRLPQPKSLCISRFSCPSHVFS